MRDRLIFRARQAPWLDRIGLSIGMSRGEAGYATHAARTLEFVEIHPNEMATDAIDLSRDEAQALVDELWILGIRPSEGTGSAGSLAATERHLADMRRVAFGALKRQGIEIDR